MSRFDEIPGGAEVYEARNAVFWLDEGIMYGRHLPDEPNITLDDAIEVIQKLRELCRGQRVPLIFDGRGLGWLNIDARGYVRANAPKVWTHAAVIVRHELIRVLAHAFLGVSGMEMPVRLFTDEEAAWAFATGRSEVA